MTIDFSRDKPIYSQLVDRICGDILKGKLVLGDRLPSVREYAVETGVNVNTVQRVYKELEAMNITETKRGQGTFITTNDGRIALLREEMKNQLADHFLTSIEALGFSKEEMLVVLQNKS
ncbi:GntR family transcriptional regulator [Lysinibacillus xylanilyticus]|uniref:GntR family transcriptional regulator n=1 Tax=Lysinibacillus xylanilyticus TaxID=582475 RepID=UPI002B24DDE5|nr:GntR family transcriptional regulator [Lysinibacillus xylanilyticus]MEB2299106.1 GntR family transcriptional regulator [Lysinibacillus xylanilyticus]